MRKILLTLFYTLLAAGFVLVLLLWVIVLRENVKHDEPVRIYLPTGSDFRALTDTLERADLLRSRESFIITSRLKSFGKTVKPGSYVIEPGMSNNSLVNMLRSGRQTPVNVTFNNIRTLEELAGKTGGQIEADSASLAEFFHDESNYSADGFTRGTLIAVFIPDTYELYWSVDPRGFYRRMLKEMMTGLRRLNHWGLHRRRCLFWPPSLTRKPRERMKSHELPGFISTGFASECRFRLIRR